MKKFLLIFLMLLSFLAFPKSVSASSKTIDLQVDKFISECSDVIPEWQNTSAIKGEKLYGVNDNVIGVLYRVFQNKEQHGYVLYLDETGITEATWKGTDRATEINGKVYYVTPGMFMSKSDFKDYLTTRVETSLPEDGSLSSTIYHITKSGTDYYKTTYPSFTLDTARIPNLTGNVTLASGPYSVRYDINDIPDYLSLIGCAPTSGGMFVGYYDNEMWEYLSSFDGTGTFPLSYIYYPSYANYSSASNLISLLATSTYMNTDSEGATNPLDMIVGLERYFANHSLSTYKVYTGSFSTSDPNFPVTSISNYEALIRRGNPSVIAMYDHPTYDDHAVLGMGYLYAASWGMGVIVHDGFPTEEGYPEEILLTYSVVSNYSFIYND